MNLRRSSNVKYLLLVPERKHLKKFRVLMPVHSKPQQRRDYSEDSRSQSTKDTEHKHNKFLPNILKNTRSTKSTFNNGISRDSDKQKTTNDNQAYEDYQNRGVTKRRRKQVLRCLQSNEGSSLTFQDSCESNHLVDFGSLSDEVSLNSENALRGKSSKIAEKTKSNYFVCNDSYTADLKSSCLSSDQQSAEHTSTEYTSDQSIEIFNKSDILDCEDYISSEDSHFHVSKKDKLLSSSTCSLAMDSSSSHGDIKIGEYDLNGNNIFSGERENQIYDMEQEWNSDNHQIDQYYSDGIEEPNKTFLEQGQDSTFGSMNDSWANELETCCLSIDNFDFDLNFDKLSSSTETASECDPTEKILPLRNFDHSSPKEAYSNNFICPLAISQMVPDNVFSDEFDESQEEGKEVTYDEPKLHASQSIPMLSKCQPTTDNFIDNINCISTELFATYDLLEYGNCLLQEKLNLGYSNSDTEAVYGCCSTSLDDHIESERKNLSNLDGIIPNLDLEDIDDIEVSKRLKLHNTNTNSPEIIPGSLPDTSVLDTSFKKSKLNKPRLLNASDILKSKHHKPSFGNIKCEDGPQKKINSLSPRTHNTIDVHETESNRQSSKPRSILRKNLSDPKCFVRKSRPNDKISACSSSILGNKKEHAVLADDVQPCARTRDIKVVTAKTVMPVDRSSKNPIKRGTPSRVQVKEKKVLCQKTVAKSDDGKLKYIDELDLDLRHDQNPHNSATYSLQTSPKKCQSAEKSCTNLRKPDPGVRKYSHRTKSNNEKNNAGHRGEKKHDNSSNLQLEKALQFSRRGGKLVCDRCSKEYCSLGFIKKHVKQHDNYNLTCRFCDAHFASKSQLKYHFHQRHLRTEYRCDYCGNCFYEKNSYLQHHDQYHDQSGNSSESII